jgi:hypothetical protein
MNKQEKELEDINAAIKLLTNMSEYGRIYVFAQFSIENNAAKKRKASSPIKKEKKKTPATPGMFGEKKKVVICACCGKYLNNTNDIPGSFLHYTEGCHKLQEMKRKYGRIEEGTAVQSNTSCLCGNKKTTVQFKALVVY